MTSKLYDIDFNRPFLTGQETAYIIEAVNSRKLSGNGTFTKRCHEFFKRRYGFPFSLLTSSCTDALEMTALLLDIQPGDEVIVPAYTFVSSANAFVLRGAKIVFADSSHTSPNVDPASIAECITSRTKAIVVVHYGGIACDMDAIMQIAAAQKIPVIEDAAHAIDAFHGSTPLGSIGTFSTFSFHETKNVISGEGGMLVVNDPQYRERAEIIWEKGTNRAAFFRGEVDKYSWVDVGSSYLPSEIIAAFLFAQLENLSIIQEKRAKVWRHYYDRLEPLESAGIIELAKLPPYASINGHLFHLVCAHGAEREKLIQFLAHRSIHAIFHYLPLHRSPFYRTHHDGRSLKQSERYSECLLRLPLYFEITEEAVNRVADEVIHFFQKR